jgi:hypothetical protein
MLINMFFYKYISLRGGYLKLINIFFLEDETEVNLSTIQVRKRDSALYNRAVFNSSLQIVHYDNY